MDLNRYVLQDLASVVVTAESLIEFKKEFSNGQNKKTSSSDKDGGDRYKSPRCDKPSIPKDKEKRKKG